MNFALQEKSCEVTCSTWLLRRQKVYKRKSIKSSLTYSEVKKSEAKTKRNIAFVDEVIAIGEVFTSKQDRDSLRRKKKTRFKAQNAEVSSNNCRNDLALRACDRIPRKV